MNSRLRSALLILTALSVLAITANDSARTQPLLPKDERPGKAPALEVRMCFEQLRNPYCYEAKGQNDEVKAFWDKKHWERVLKAWADEGYNAILYWPEPWTETAWPAFLIPHTRFPEARELTPEQTELVIEHVKWIFAKAHDCGLKNFLF